MSRKQQYKAILSKDLLKYHITWHEHKSTPEHLFIVSQSFRDYIYSVHTYNDTFTWWSPDNPMLWRDIAMRNPRVRHIILRENRDWMLGIMEQIK